MKMLWGRMRYRDMLSAGTTEGFTPWYVVNIGNGEEAYKSFPSGHTSSAANIFILAALCDVFPRLNNFRARAVINTGCFIFTVLVAVSRIVNCAHFLSDVLAGGYITYLIFVLTRWLFFRNGKYEFTFKEKTAAVADGSAEGGEEVENTSAQNGADNGCADADCGKPREKGEE